MKNTEISTGICSYCGQGRTVQVPQGSSQEYTDSIASKTCFCSGAAQNRLYIKTVESVNTIFGYECTGGFKPVSEDELDYLIRSVKALSSGVINKVTITLTSGGTCKMKFKDIECIEVQREEKKTARA